LDIIVAPMTLVNIFGKITLDTILAFDTTVEFVILLGALVTSSPAMWRREHLWNFSVLKPVSFLLCVIKQGYRQ
jgi:hypothetical protein